MSDKPIRVFNGHDVAREIRRATAGIRRMFDVKNAGKLSVGERTRRIEEALDNLARLEEDLTGEAGGEAVGSVSESLPQAARSSV